MFIFLSRYTLIFILYFSPFLPDESLPVFFLNISYPLNLPLTILSPQHTPYLSCQLNYPSKKQWICVRTVQQTKNPRAGTIFPNCPNSRKSLVFCTFPLFYFSTLDINTTHSTCREWGIKMHLALVC